MELTHSIYAIILTCFESDVTRKIKSFMYQIVSDIFKLNQHKINPI